MKLNLSQKVYKSRRGDYRLAIFDRPLTWVPTPLGESDREINVMAEVAFAKDGNLAHHPYWKDEPLDFVEQYSKMYVELFELQWLHNQDDRHNIVVNRDCCLTLIQYHDGTLYAYSRSTDMKNGYHSDRLILEYLAEIINHQRPDCKVERITWFMAIPHVYVDKGIARLLEVKK